MFKTRTLARLALGILMAGGAASAEASPFAYVPSNNDQTVTVIDTATNAVVAPIAVSGRPRGIALNDAGTVVYATQQVADGVVVINAFTNQVVTVIPIGPLPIGFPEDIAYSGALQRLYVSTLIDRVVVIDTTSNTVMTTIPLTVDASEITGIAVTPDGSKAYATRKSPAELFVIDTATNTVSTSIPGGGSQGVVFNDAGTIAYAANAQTGDVNVIDVATDAVTSSIPMGFLCGPVRLALTPAETELYVSCQLDNSVKVVDLVGETVTDTISVGTSPIGLAITPDGSRVLAVNLSTDDVSIIDTATNTVVDTVGVGDEPTGRGSFIGPAFSCGNTVIEPGEACDDGNLIDDDACTNDCLESHDTVLVAPKPKKIVIGPGKAFVTKPVTVQVVNADVLPLPEIPGHTVVLSATSDCPPGAVAQPDFDKIAPGIQDSLVVLGEEKVKARILVSAYASDFTTFNSKTPTRCTITVTASGLLGTVDPTPENNVATIEIDVIDKNDPEQSAVHESFARSLKPLKIKLRDGVSQLVKLAKPQAGNGDFLPLPEDPSLHTVTVTSADGDCPPGTVGIVDFDPATAGAQPMAQVEGGKFKTGKLAITINAADFTSASALSPARCTASVTVAGPPGDTEASNQTTQFLIDVFDENDF